MRILVAMRQPLVAAAACWAAENERFHVRNCEVAALLSSMRHALRPEEPSEGTAALRKFATSEVGVPAVQPEAAGEGTALPATPA